MAIKMKSSVAFFLLVLCSVLAVKSASVKFTPEAMLSAPRRGTAEPNPAGTLALFTVSTYSFQKHKTSQELRVLDLQTGNSTLFTNSSVGEAHWLGEGNKIIWVVYEDDGSTSFVVGDATKPSEKPTIAGSVPGSAENIKLTSLDGGAIAIVFTGLATPNGSLYNEALAETPLSSARLYTSLFVRHWDTYVTQQRNSIFYSALSQVATGNSTVKYAITDPVNALNGTGLESPIPPFGGTDNFDVSKAGIIFVAKDITLDQANTTKSDVYYIPLKTFSESVAPKPQIFTTTGLEGASTVPVFSNCGTKLAFLRQKDLSYESDKWRILVADATNCSSAVEFYATENGGGGWDRSPNGLLWSNDDKELYVTAEDYARVRLFSVPSNPAEAKSLPSLIYKEGTISDVQTLASDSSSNALLVSSTSIVDNSIFSTIDPAAAASSNATNGIKLVSANLEGGAKYGLSQSQISETYWKGDGDYNVHSWIIKPSFWKENGIYPLAYIIHGGPQGAWEDSWSTRWNLAIYAEQGYVVVAPNPTGSTGFGQKLTDDIQNQWGGRPYNDLVLGFDHIEKNFPYIDTNRSVTLGASYGGYMTYWIQGNPLGRKFKAIVSHDGSFNTLSQYSSDELWFMQHDFNGTLWNNFENYARWNPANHTDQWSTPHLIIHSDLDYRLPISEGLSAFNVLQERGVPSKFLNFPDENHWVLKPENSLVWHKTVLDWINKHTGLPLYSQASDTEYRATLQNGQWI